MEDVSYEDITAAVALTQECQMVCELHIIVVKQWAITREFYTMAGNIIETDLNNLRMWSGFNLLTILCSGRLI